MTSKLLASVVVFLLSCISLLASAQSQETRATVSAYAAGYKAAFTCSAIFNADKTLAQINEHELSGIYPLVAELVESLPAADIDYQAKRVSVTFDDALPPRIAQWRPHLGCAQLPVGANVDAVKYLPNLRIKAPIRNDEAPWNKHVQVNGTTGNSALDKVIKSAFRGDEFNSEFGENALTTAVLIATPNEIIAEYYIDGYSHTTSQRTWSVAKSIAATVIGAAVEQDIIELQAPTAINTWQAKGDPRASITLEDLLQMASGLDSNQAGNRTDRLYIGGGRVSDTAATTALETRPGIRWKYANNDTLLAMHALRSKMRDDEAYWRFPFENVLHKIGMLDTRLETDWGGDFILSSQVWTTSRDMVRLGILYLNDGVWQGERILPQGWSEYVARASGPQPAGNGPGYGAQFWLYNERFPNIPNDAYAARGNRGQYLMIIPSKNLVIVRRGYDPAKPGNFQLHTFTEAVLEALEQ